MVTLRAPAPIAGMGVGRFDYPPILPLKLDQAGLSTSAGATELARAQGGWRE